MIIVEGPDGAGKTTLIEQLTEEFKLPVAPRVVSKEATAMVDLQEWVDENLNKGAQPVIFDRHRLISEPIYGPIMGRNSEPGFSDLAWMGPRLHRLYQLKPFIIYCLPSKQEVLRNVIGDPDNRAIEEKIGAIYDAYVAKVGMDLHLANTPISLWNYERSPKIDGKPLFFNALRRYIKENFA